MIKLIKEKDLDKKATRNNVHRLLTHYRRLEMAADAEYAPKVTQEFSFDIKGTGGKVASAVENAVIKKVDSQSELEKIARAINKLGDEKRQLIYDRYLSKSEVPDIQIYNDMHVSKTTYYRRLGKAQIDFAYAYENGTLLELKEDAIET